MNETPDQIHGRLMEAVHIIGYTAERACAELKWLLTDDRWRSVGGGFTDGKAFLATVAVGDFKLSAEQRKDLHRMMAALDGVSQRAIGRATGADEKTVRNDLRAERSAIPAVAGAVDLREPETAAEDSAPPPPVAVDGRKAALTVSRRQEREQRDAEAEQRRQARVAETARRADPEVTVRIECGDFEQVLGNLTDVDAVITDPPYGRDALPLLPRLAAWADKVLKPDGVLVVMYGQSHLPDALFRLSGGRPYRWAGCYITPGNGWVSHDRRVQTNWKPLLVYGGGPRFGDVVDSADLSSRAKAPHPWGQDYWGVREIVERFTNRGEVIADPFMGSGTTLAAAQSLGRHSAGADISPAHYERVKTEMGL